jgi:hypothetical protein
MRLGRELEVGVGVWSETGGAFVGLSAGLTWFATFLYSGISECSRDQPRGEDGW